MTGSSRQVALLLHGLSDPDRSWMLEQLGPAQAQVLNPLLAELRELGMPADPALTAQALASGAARMAGKTPASDPGAVVRAATAGQLQQALAGEPPGLVAVLLAGGDWPWREAFLAAQEPAKARVLRELLTTLQGGAALQRAVVRAVALRLAGLPQLPVPAQRPTPAWTHFMRRLPRLPRRHRAVPLRSEA